MFTHIGFKNSTLFFLSDLSTSTAVDRPDHQLSEKIFDPNVSLYYAIVKKSKNEIIHTYRHRFRTWYVLPEKYFELFKLIYDTLNEIFYYPKYSERDNTFYRLEDAVEKCNGFDDCFNTVKWFREVEVPKMESKIKKMVTRAREKLFRRFYNNTAKYYPVIKKYFPDFENPTQIVFSGIDEAENYLRKFFNARHARRYADFLYNRKFIVVMPHDIIEIFYDASPEDYILFADGCNETSSYAVCKIVASHSSTLEYKKIWYGTILWIAVIGYDKLSNQRFLHYVPPFLILRDVETCRKWILGLVDERGRPINNYDIELIET